MGVSPRPPLLSTLAFETGLALNLFGLGCLSSELPVSMYSRLSGHLQSCSCGFGVFTQVLCSHSKHFSLWSGLSSQF